jgi:hypothetical protein
MKFWLTAYKTDCNSHNTEIIKLQKETHSKISAGLSQIVRNGNTLFSIITVAKISLLLYGL